MAPKTAAAKPAKDRTEMDAKALARRRKVLQEIARAVPSDRESAMGLLKSQNVSQEALASVEVRY